MKQEILKNWLKGTIYNLEETRRKFYNMNKIKATIEGNKDKTAYSVHLKLVERHKNYTLTIKINLWKQSFKLESSEFVFNLNDETDIKNKQSFNYLKEFIDESEVL